MTDWVKFFLNFTLKKFEKGYVTHYLQSWILKELIDKLAFKSAANPLKKGGKIKA